MSWYSRMRQVIRKWEEDQHPRDEHGKFIDSGESPTAAGEKEYAEAVAGKRDAWVPASGGKELPSVDKLGRRKLRVFNPATGEHGDYDMGTDIVTSDSEAKTIGNEGSAGLSLAARKLFTKAIWSKMPPIGSTSDKEPEEVKVVAKLFGGSGYTAYITEADPKTGEAFGYVTFGQGGELGYMDLNEIAATKFPPFGLGVERDRYYTPETLADVMKRGG